MWDHRLRDAAGWSRVVSDTEHRCLTLSYAGGRRSPICVGGVEYLHDADISVED